MTGEKLPDETEQPKPPNECWFVKQTGRAAMANMEAYPFAQFCNECTLLRGDLDIQYGIGQAAIRVMNPRKVIEGCPGEGINVYNAVPPPLRISRPWVEQREQQQPPGPALPDQLPPPPSA